MKYLFSFLLLSCALKASALVVLAPDETVLLNVSSRGSIHVSRSGIIGVKDLGHRLKITAKKRGVTYISQGSTSHEIRVIRKPNWETWTKLIKHQISSSGLKVELVEETPYLTGTLFELAEFKSLIGLFAKSDFVFRANIPLPLQPQISKFIEHIFHQHGLPKAKILFDPYLIVAVPERTLEMVSLYEKVLAPFGVQVQHQKSVFPLNSSIDLTLTFVEVRAQWLRSLGLQWPSQHSFQLLPQWLPSDQLSTFLQAAENQGDAHLYASPRLVTRSGEKAEFHSGGEFPIRVSGFQNQSLFWKKYGLLLSALPKVDSHGNMIIQLEFEISSLDQSRSIDGLPGILSHKLSTQVELSRPQPFIISSLVKKDTGVTNDGVPFLKHIPILGQLFKSSNELEQQTELVVFIDPKIIGHKAEPPGPAPSSIAQKIKHLKQRIYN